MRMLLDDDHACVVLQVEQVPHVLGHLRPTGAEVWTGEVAHDLEELLPLGLLLITDQEERNRHVSDVSEAMLTKCGEGDVRHLLNSVINLAPHDGSLPWHRGVNGYLHLDITNVQAVGLKGMAVVDGNQPVVAELDKSAQELSWKP
jgi:hypothetical protein